MCTTLITHCSDRVGSLPTSSCIFIFKYHFGRVSTYVLGGSSVICGIFLYSADKESTGVTFFLLNSVHIVVKLCILLSEMERKYSARITEKNWLLNSIGFYEVLDITNFGIPTFF